jgi:hypothetical protein
MPVAKDRITLSELKLLLESIIATHANIRMKCMLAGGKWTGEFLSIIMVTGKGVILNDDAADKITSISLLSQVLQFVVDKPFDGYSSNLTYEVDSD